MKNRSKPKIYQYNDIVSFLNDVVIFFKSKANTSLREISKELGIASGLLPMVLSRKRTPAETLIEKIMKKFNYAESEISFAKNLRIVGCSDNYEERRKAIYKINKNKNYRDSNLNEYEIYKYLSNWYFVAIKEMTDLSCFQEDCAWIQKQLAYPVSLKKIENALAFLKKNKILVYEKGKLKASQKDMNCEEGIFKLTLGGFHKQILSLAGEAIDNVPREKRRILGHTFKVDQDSLVELNAILSETFERIKALTSQTKEAEEIVHVQLVAIPITIKSEDI